jgi:hypothetical protein
MKVALGGQLLVLPAVGPDDQMSGKVGESSTTKGLQYSREQVVYENEESDNASRHWFRQAVDLATDLKIV